MFTKMVKQLKREALANKGKASVLGLVVLIALYFWLPLVADCFKSAPDGEAVAQPVAAAAAPAAPTGSSASPEAEQVEWPAHPWLDLIAWMDSDPMMKSTGVPAGVGNPFRWSAPPEGFAVNDGEEEEELEEDEPKPEVTPQTLGMVLTSTLIGPKVSVVKISGKTYVFDRGTANGDGRPSTRLVFKNERGEFEFEVLSVRSGVVILGRADKQYELRIQPPTLLGDESIQFLTSH
jgi:hypothetical protein